MDGSQKIPQRWLQTLAHQRSQGRVCPAIMAGMTAWVRHLRGENGPVDDPLAARLKSLVASRNDASAIEAVAESIGHPSGKQPVSV
jgi:fructuronate reductase